MRVVLDANVILSLAAFRSKTIQEAFDDVAENREMPVPTCVVDEARDVVARKWPSRSAALEEFFQRASFETVPAPAEPEEGLFDIRDPKDRPVPCSAILADADVLVTGDKDFGDVDVDRSEILTPAERVESYVRRG